MIDYEKKTLNELLAYEVTLIEDDKITAFVKETLDVVDPAHCYKSASSTGKYHPRYALGKGGLIRHIKVVVRNIVDLIRATPALECEKDELIAAAILHDMWKYPEGRDHTYTAFDHPALGGDYCKQHGFETVGRLIAAHQGIWTTSNVMPGFVNEQPRKFDEWALHYADYFASRTYLQCEFDEAGELVLDWQRQDEMKKIKEGRRIIKDAE